MLEALALAFVAAFFGAAAAVAVVFLASTGERGRFEATLVPINTAIADLEDRLDQWRKRENKRARDDRGAAGSPRNDDLEGVEPVGRLSTEQRLAALKARIRGTPWASGRL